MTTIHNQTIPRAHTFTINLRKQENAALDLSGCMVLTELVGRTLSPSTGSDLAFKTLPLLLRALAMVLMVALTLVLMALGPTVT